VEPVERTAPLIAVERPTVDEERGRTFAFFYIRDSTKGKSTNLRALCHEAASLAGVKRTRVVVSPKEPTLFLT